MYYLISTCGSERSKVIAIYDRYEGAKKLSEYLNSVGSSNIIVRDVYDKDKEE